MELPDLTSSDLLLGIDLVGSWQIDKVKEQSLWPDWPSNDTLRAMQDHCNSGQRMPAFADPMSVRRVNLMQTWISEEANTDKSQSRDLHYALEWFDGGLDLISWEAVQTDQLNQVWLLPCLRMRSICRDIRCEKAPRSGRVSPSPFTLAPIADWVSSHLPNFMVSL